MPRRLLSCLVLLMLILQGMAQVSANAVPESALEEHCAGHESAGEGCPCCADELMKRGGCAGLCSGIAVLSTLSLPMSCPADAERLWLVIRTMPGPAYLPLNPPPIS